VWRAQPDCGELLACTTLTHSNEPYFQQKLPWSIGLIRLDCGPSVVAHLHGRVTAAGMTVRVALCLDRAGCGVLVAFPFEEVIDLSADRQLSQLSCDPRSRRVLVTNAVSETGRAVVHALSAAGAGTVWAGSAGTPVSFPTLGNVIPVALDVTHDASVASAAASLGSDVDILINTAEREPRTASVPGLDSARLDMETYYFGLMRLAREFGARMRTRNAKGELGAIAWLNLLSIHALASTPAQESFAAAEAAAHSLSQSLRAQMLGAGVRVINVFVAPGEQGADELAAEIVTSLRSGIEDAYAGDLAKHLFARWRDNPKGLERELATSG
jgi:NAD(P)-dependent dehydrogenase (short-subunit alcohol dehydrogenase family)